MFVPVAEGCRSHPAQVRHGHGPGSLLLGRRLLFLRGGGLGVFSSLLPRLSPSRRPRPLAGHRPRRSEGRDPVHPVDLQVLHGALGLEAQGDGRPRLALEAASPRRCSAGDGASGCAAREEGGTLLLLGSVGGGGGVPAHPLQRPSSCGARRGPGLLAAHHLLEGREFLVLLHRRERRRRLPRYCLRGRRGPLPRCGRCRWRQRCRLRRRRRLRRKQSRRHRRKGWNGRRLPRAAAHDSREGLGGAEDARRFALVAALVAALLVLARGGRRRRRVSRRARRRSGKRRGRHPRDPHEELGRVGQDLVV
mmetsp:Transcript_19724/g.37082  ORF Transcript_19724/g.37082 Transcript_19724/m.37082 type:complete len:307 (+) Transcript_19724:1033-1953(+)